MKHLAWMAATVAVLAWAHVASAQTVDEVLKNMAAKAETIRDLHVWAKVVKFDSVFEKKSEVKLEVWYKRPDLTRIDSYKKMPTGAEVLTQLVIIGKDYVLRAQPQERPGKATITRVDPAKMKEDREASFDPMTFFTRTPEDVKKDFDVALKPTTRPNSVMLVLRPKRDGIIDYKAVELTVDKATWLPAAVRTMAGGEDDDWQNYEFTLVLLNTYFPDVMFANPPGYVVEEVRPAPEKK